MQTSTAIIFGLICVCVWLLATVINLRESLTAALIERDEAEDQRDQSQSALDALEMEMQGADVV